jgi:O-acetyl-ADP-ribose deacetylase (regulator of RNase III)
LKNANKKECKSISIPAIGSGIYSIPKEVCAKILLEVAIDHLENKEDSTVNEIRFVNFDENTVEYFSKEFNKVFNIIDDNGDEKNDEIKEDEKNDEKKENSDDDMIIINNDEKNDEYYTTGFYNVTHNYYSNDYYTNNDYNSNSSSNYNSNSSSNNKSNSLKNEIKLEHKTEKGKIIKLIKGDLTRENTDVIVNTANTRLSLSGGLSSAIVKNGGYSIEEECDKYIEKKGELEVGDIYISKAGELECKAIFHAIGPQW